MNIFLDAGFYVGVALQMYIDAATVDDSWTIYAFEPTPVSDIKDRLKNFPPLTLIKKAAWIKDGNVSFSLSSRENASFINGTSYSGAPKKEVKVACVDFSRFLAELPEAYIICSMDIEGSEFKVLEKCIADGTASKINLLDIEFHHRFMADYTKEDSVALCRKLRDMGVQIRIKEAFA